MADDIPKLPRIMWYVLDDKDEPAPCRNLRVWSEFMANDPRRLVATTGNDAIRISTIFLGLDHSHGWRGAPILYETMVFRSGHADVRWFRRYATRARALEGHAAIVAEVFPALADREGDVP